MQETYFPIITKENLKLPIYLHSIGKYFEETDIKRPNGFPAYQWIQCYQGEGLFVYDKEEYIIKKGQGIFIYPTTPHYYYATKKPWKTHWIAFDGYSIHSLLNIIGITKTDIYNILDPNILKNKIITCFQLSTSNNLYTSIETSAYLYQFFIDLVKNTKPIYNNSLYQHYSKLQPVIDYIDTYYSQPLSIDLLAKQINVTPQYLCILFQKIMQKRPFEYINEVRIKKSKELILNNYNYPITTISTKVGFESPSYFGSQFKKIEGITPGQFKQLYISS
jgi:YesN/AraC family two-component response regulator